MRGTYAEIDLGAIAQNVTAFADLVAPSEVCAVVKADGYGHGDVPVASAAVSAGATSLAVALVEEGIRLREAGVSAPILLLSEPRLDAVEDIVKWELNPAVYSKAFIGALADSGARHDVHLKIDTGMHRVGTPPHRMSELLGLIGRAPNLTLAGLWTHFAVADEDREFTRLQIQRFDEAKGDLDVPLEHLANTAGAALFPDSRRDLCRVGIGIYGLHPCPDTRELVTLEPAMKVVSEVTHVQHLKGRERPSYGRRRELSVDSNVVTVPIGYADGYPRALSESGVAIIGGKKFPLAGTVTMDQIVIDVGDEDIDVGEEVVLLGDQGDVSETADDWAQKLGTISYEVVCSIGPRVTRRYLSHE